MQNKTLYTEQDNQQLNDQISNLTTGTVDKEKTARGQTSCITMIDDAGFVEKEVEPQSAMDTKVEVNHVPATKTSFTEGGIQMNTQPAGVNIDMNAINRAREQLGDSGGAVVLGAGNDQLFKNIKDIFTSPEAKPKTKNFFTQGKGVTAFNIDNSIFSPTPVTCLAGKRFEDKYVQQLESYIFNNKDELDPDKLIALIYIVGIVHKGHTPITIVTGKYRHLLPKIIAGLNKYFAKNYSTLFSIYTMFNGMSTIQPEVKEKNELIQ